MKLFKNFFLLSLLASVVMFTACGDDDGGTTTDPNAITITGTVTSESGGALEGVTITEDADANNSVTTGADGTYSITMAAGSFTFTACGYEDHTHMMTESGVHDYIMVLDQGAKFGDYFASAGNSVGDPGFDAGSVRPNPSAVGGQLSATPAGMDAANYKGAVDPSGTPWYDGWSFYSNLVSGNANSNPITLGNLVTITDADMQAAGNDVQWTNDNTYVLDGFVFVGDGQTLTIEAGTVVQGKAGQEADATALIVARGGKIIAEGTADSPIIFTFEGDQGNTPATERGRWGGLIILGKAGLNSNPGETQIEGLPTNEARGLYGGNDDADNSGVLRYVSIRHGGTNIGADNEINGLTLGGVGSGTTFEYIEVIGNKDDGIEWFGGTAQAKHLIVAFCADDALDYDEGYRGWNQFVIAHQDSAPDAADRGGEHDGGTDPEDGSPYATPIFFNVTSVGNADSRTLTFRDNAGGEYHNSIFVNYGKGIDIEELCDTDQDSYKQWEDGNLKLENNLFFNIGAGTTGRALFTVTLN